MRGVYVKILFFEGKKFYIKYIEFRLWRRDFCFFLRMEDIDVIGSLLYLLFYMGGCY